MKPFEDWNNHTAAQCERALGYVFQNKALLKTCFTHKTYANQTGEEHNERLEFLGDAVLQLVVSEALYKREGGSEGGMTEKRKQFVSQSALTAAAERAGILAFLRYAGGDDTVRGKTPSNLFEAVVAGIYLDGGMGEARAFLKRFLTEIQTNNYKTLLQEAVQAQTKEQPVYCTQQTQEGYVCTVSAQGKSASGTGTSKKAAETQAAQALYSILIARVE